MRETFEQRQELSNRDTLRLFRRAIGYVAPYKGRFAVKAALTIVSLFPPLLLPWPIKMQIDHVIEGRPVDPAGYPFFFRPVAEALVGASASEIIVVTLLCQLLLVVAFGMLGSTGTERDQADARLSSGRDTATTTENDANYGHSRASGILGLFEFRWTLRLTQDLNHHYRSRLFERIHSLPITAFDDERIGDAIYRVMYDTPAITQVVYRLLLIPLYSPLGIALVAWTLHSTYQSTAVGWVALAFLPLALVATLPFAARIRRQGEESRMAGATTASTIEESVSNVLAVQSLGAGERERERFDRHSGGSFDEFRRYIKLWIFATFAVIAVGIPLIVGITRYGVSLVVQGVFTPGDFALMVAYFIQVTTYAAILGTLWIRLQGNAAGLHRVFVLMDLPGERDEPDATPLPPLQRELRIEGVDFGYEDGTPALQGVDVRARIGEVVALAGAAGAGKTSLAYLIPRFLRPDAGRVLFDGADIADATIDSVRSQVAFVFQETQLFDASVEQNIRVGKPDASDTEVRRAARTAGADDFIRALPEGYRTQLGRAGGKLSVGQKQRLAIARALVREAPILILDEPTSALDPETERRLVESLREAAHTRLVVVIAHRLSTIRGADEILFLEHGRIIERGRHAELMERPDGAYRHFVELQTRGAA
ncbi:MAG: ABC transporter ATP-binding protein [Deltaproteobacteria bacterium]|nr:ABC transporter ATP-binding protein [Deltaproteobacteria bacterium]